MAKHLRAPLPQKTMPRGIPFIVVNEAAERFSFYGMRTILVIFMTQHLVDQSGALDLMSEAEAKSWYHIFVFAVYFMPLAGAVLADAWLGKYRTILALSLVYCTGHLALALDESRAGLAAGLILIAIGSGGIKSCVSAHVGDQFGASNAALLPRVFSMFYFAINLGAAASTALTPVLLVEYGPRIAFGVPGALMALATLFFWMGRNVFVHIPPAGRSFFKETFGREGLGILGRLFVLYSFIAMFWALFDQTGSAWVLQAREMDRVILGHELLPSQIQAANPILILIFIPLFSYGLYPALEKIVRLTPLRKIGIGLFLTVPAFLLPALAQRWIDAGEHVSIGWQLAAYVIMTAAEVLVSITALEFSYTQAPKRMKSFVMGTFLASVALGNVFTAGVNFFIANDDGSSRLEGENYYLFFAATMFVTALLYVPMAARFKVKSYLQDELAPEAHKEALAEGISQG